MLQAMLLQENYVTFIHNVTHKIKFRSSIFEVFTIIANQCHRSLKWDVSQAECSCSSCALSPILCIGSLFDLSNHLLTFQPLGQNKGSLTLGISSMEIVSLKEFNLAFALHFFSSFL